MLEAASTLAGVVLLLLFGLLKLARQAGRIEQGVAGIYTRLDRLERWMDQHLNGR